MAKRRTTTKASTGRSPMEIFRRGNVPSADVATRGMVALGKELERQFREQRTRDAAAAAYAEKFYAPIFDLVHQNPAAAKALRELRGATGSNRKPLKPPRLARVPHGVFLGSLSATAVPPYDYPITWLATEGDPQVPELSANQTEGTMAFHLSSAAASASTFAGVGIYFRPPTERGVLKVSATPSYNYIWSTNIVNGSAHSDAFLGLCVNRFSTDGVHQGADIVQRNVLWDDGGGYFWPRLEQHDGSNSGSPLFAQLNVEGAYFYILWVWCGGRATGSGWTPVSNGSAESILSVTVPSITWEYDTTCYLSD